MKIIKNAMRTALIVLSIIALTTGMGLTQTPPAGEEALFTNSTSPDALILLDLSGSMLWNPNGDDRPYGSTTSCYADTANCTGTGCGGGFCTSSRAGTSYYANASCAVPDSANCQGSGCTLGFCSTSRGSSTFYAAATCSTANTVNCRGTSCGRSDGFCNSSVSGFTYYAASSCTTADTYNCSSDRWSDCSGGFCSSSHTYSSRRTNLSCTVPCTTTGCTTLCTTGSCNIPCTTGGCSSTCSRLAIAKRALFNILDDNNDNVINSSDEGSLGVRLGYMRYYNCGDDDTGNDYTSGCNSLIRAIGSKYSLIYCANSTSCTGSSSSASSISGENASGGTPIGSALNEARLYLDAHKLADTAKNCRQKFVIFITDGSDTFSCESSGAECGVDRYMNRRESVAKAKALAKAGYKVFVIGFGTSMPPYLQNTLNWMAYYGGTDNPSIANSGSTTAYSLGADDLYPAGITSCMDESAPVTTTCYDATYPYPGTGRSQADYRAAANDPGYLNLSGYAFLATDADQLAAAVKTAINIIREATYSFSQSSVQSARTTDENYLYEGSFEPIPGDPFWRGHLKKYQINADGNVGTLRWDAGEKMKTMSASSRTIKTKRAGGAQADLTDFTTANLTPADVGITTGTDTEKNNLRNAIVNYIRGDAAYNPEQDASSNVWKLGDVFRSTPITVGTPSAFFDDLRDCKNQFAAHRSGHERSSAIGNRLIVAGANDGQFHAFKTHAEYNSTTGVYTPLAGDGDEAWSFVPPNLLTKLKNITHTTHPSSLTHQFFVDGPVTVADVWDGTSTTTGCSTACSDDGNCKADSSWRTILVFGLGRGAVNYSWSSSATCDSGISNVYSTTYPYYCGYHALNLTESLSPTYLWHLNFADATAQAAQAPYIGDPWSKMMIGRVRVKESGVEKEKWVGFIGAGYNASDCSGVSCDTRGKGFFVVNLNDGKILWSYTHADNANMDYSIPGQPAIVDTDNDGFIDTAYVGDIGGNVWRFKFCRYADMYPGTSSTPSCAISGLTTAGTTNWSGGSFYASSSGNIRPIYTSPAVAKDATGNFWVYWGSGDKTDPTASSAQERFYGVKDNRTSSYGFNNLDNITSSSQTYNPASTTNVGFALNLAGGGQKVLADSTVFGGVVYFTAFTPASGNDPCEQAGSADLFALNYVTGGGALSGGARSMYIGSGIPSAPVMSMKPGGSVTPDLYVTTSGGSGTTASTQRVDITPAGVSNRTNMLYWKDMRIQ